MEPSYDIHTRTLRKFFLLVLGLMNELDYYRFRLQRVTLQY